MTELLNYYLFYFQPQYYQALISEVLSRIDEYKGTSSVIKTSMVLALTHIISFFRDSVGWVSLKYSFFFFLLSFSCSHFFSSLFCFD